MMYTDGAVTRRRTGAKRCHGCAAAWTLRCLSPAPLLLIGLLITAAVARAQTIPPAPAASASPVQTPAVGLPAGPPRKLDNKEIAQRPYNPIFTPPQFPSSQRQQKQFTVQYVYNYAESTYTPAVPLPSVAKSAAKFDTPENALIALYSTMRNADFSGFLNCWDEPSRAALDAQMKASPPAKQELLAAWKNLIAGKTILLTHRLETVNYVVLDAVVQNAYGPGRPFADSEVLVFEKGRWTLSNQFQTDGLITQHDFKAEGDKVTYDFDLRPLLPEGGAGAAANHAQEAFLKTHNQRSAVSETVE